MTGVAATAIRSDPAVRTMLEAYISLRLRAQGDCLVWTGSRNKHGYGTVTFRAGLPHRKVSMLVHRAVYELQGGPIPERYELDHLCGTRPCARLEHLEALPSREHKRRTWGRKGDFKPFDSPDSAEMRVFLYLLDERGIKHWRIA